MSDLSDFCDKPSPHDPHGDCAGVPMPPGMSEKPEHDLVLIQKEGVLLLECRICHELVENLGFETTPLVMNSAGIRHYREKNEDLQAAVRAVEKFEEDST